MAGRVKEGANNGAMDVKAADPTSDQSAAADQDQPSQDQPTEPQQGDQGTAEDHMDDDENGQDEDMPPRPPLTVAVNRRRQSGDIMMPGTPQPVVRTGEALTPGTPQPSKIRRTLDEAMSDPEME